MTTASPQKRYVVGFWFSASGADVALIHKNRPDWQKGRRNGIGGGIEEGETPKQAMEREAVEEAGDAADGVEWEEIGTLEDEGAHVTIFRAFSDRVYAVRSQTDEPVTVHPVARVLELHTVNNIRWLVPLAQDRNSGIEFPLHFRFA